MTSARSFVLPICAVMALSLPALLLALQQTQAQEATRTHETGWPRTIQHEAGPLTLAAPPKRVISTTPSVTGILLAINAPVISSAATTPSILTDGKGFFSQWAQLADERDVSVLYKNLTFDMEAVIGADPDLVVVSATGADNATLYYDELVAQGIPTIVVNYSNHRWQELATQLGQATGREQDAQAAIGRFNAYAAKVAATLAPPETTATIVGYNLGGSYSIARPESPHARLLTALGFTLTGLPDELSSQVTRRSDFDFISRENLTTAIGGETVFLLNGTDADVEAFLADPVLANLPAVKKRQVYPLGPTSFRIDYYSGRQMIDAVARHFRTP
ncbi:Fe2+-enterobactin ABC transporter substrate-binding protein [Xanthobacter sp. TB0139]|uniref:Fe2+-enterobactin ABC transporter substrate-binding protein n=1 Tax=Xanthobacter sp. TB0139 TaxID=3459178 RepID=UPI0040390E5F